jgi:iron complex transport system ATP-binding protein
MTKHVNDSDPILSIKDLKVRQNGVEILKGINWTVLPGQHWAILGPNGCGKSTLISAITAYVTPVEGSLELIGQRYGEADWQELRKQIGIVSSTLTSRVPADETAVTTVHSGESAQLDYWSREDNLDRTKALRCMGKMAIRSLAEREWGILSQGERQKVFIARSLMLDPKLIILDEPCAGLDPVARERFLRSIQKLIQKKRSPSIVFVTHHIEEIVPEITHVLLIKNGKVLNSGTKREVLNSKNLSAVFGADLKASKRPKLDRWTLSLN